MLSLIGGYRFGSARRDDTSAVGSSARAEVDDVVGVAYHVQIVFDDDQGSPCRKQMPEDFEQCPDVERVEPDGGLVENEESESLCRRPISEASFSRCASPPERLGVACRG